jgi:hypothetical protein
LWDKGQGSSPHTGSVAPSLSMARDPTALVCRSLSPPLSEDLGDHSASQSVPDL